MRSPLIRRTFLWRETGQRGRQKNGQAQVEVEHSGARFHGRSRGGDHLLWFGVGQTVRGPGHPLQAAELRVTESWQRRAELPSLYGRFALRYDGTGPAKMLEYNADTPTSLVEAASAQWFWMEDRFPDADQWNSLHERLVAVWTTLVMGQTLPVAAPARHQRGVDREPGARYESPGSSGDRLVLNRRTCSVRPPTGLAPSAGRGRHARPVSRAAPPGVAPGPSPGPPC